MVSTQDKKWMAQDDARILIQAEAIKTDSKRFRPAIKELKQIAKDKAKEAAAAAKIAKKKK